MIRLALVFGLAVRLEDLRAGVAAGGRWARRRFSPSWDRRWEALGKGRQHRFVLDA